MAKDTSGILGLDDEALDAPELQAVPGYNPPPCGPGRVCIVSDEALDPPVQQANSGCGCACWISDEALEALEAPEQHAITCRAPCGICSPPCYVSDEALDTPTQHALPICGVCFVSDEALNAPDLNAAGVQCVWVCGSNCTCSVDIPADF